MKNLSRNEMRHMTGGVSGSVACGVDKYYIHCHVEPGTVFEDGNGNPWVTVLEGNQCWPRDQALPEGCTIVE